MPNIENLGRIMTDLLNQLQENNPSPQVQLEKDCSKISYYKARTEEDPFPKPSLLYPNYKDQPDDINATVRELKKSTKKHELAGTDNSNLNGLLRDHMDIFRTLFLSGPVVKLPPVKNYLTSKAKSVKIKLCEYSRDQQDFTERFFDDLVELRLLYDSPTYKWARALLLVPGPVVRIISRSTYAPLTSSTSSTTTRLQT